MKKSFRKRMMVRVFLDIFQKQNPFQVKTGLALLVLLFSNTVFAAGTSYNETTDLPFRTKLSKEELTQCSNTPGMYVAPDGSCRTFKEDLLWEVGQDADSGENNFINFPRAKGNVGIGLTTDMPPDARLDVSGAIKLRSNTDWNNPLGDTVNKLYAIGPKLVWSNQNLATEDYVTGVAGSAATGLERITDGKTGWRFVSALLANYGPIGAAAVDLSQSEVANSAVMGATGDNSVAMGKNTAVSGVSSFVGGLGANGLNHTQVDGASSFAYQEVTASGGVKIVAARNSAILGGQNNSVGAAATKSVVLGGSDQAATQPDMVYISGTKYKSYTTAEINALTDSELGTFLFDSTKGKLVQCTDDTSGSLVWTVLGGKFVSGTNAADAVYATGDVGIGIADPVKALHVNGGARFDNTSGADAVEIGGARIYWDTGNNELVILVNPAS